MVDRSTLVPANANQCRHCLLTPVYRTGSGWKPRRHRGRLARDVKRGKTLPLITRLQSPAREGHRSENRDILSVMEAVQRQLHSKPLWVIDRGRDGDSTMWKARIKGDREVLVRAANQRFWFMVGHTVDGPADCP